MLLAVIVIRRTWKEKLRKRSGCTDSNQFELIWSNSLTLLKWTSSVIITNTQFMSVVSHYCYTVQYRNRDITDLMCWQHSKLTPANSASLSVLSRRQIKQLLSKIFEEKLVLMMLIPLYGVCKFLFEFLYIVEVIKFRTVNHFLPSKSCIISLHFNNLFLCVIVLYMYVFILSYLQNCWTICFVKSCQIMRRSMSAHKHCVKHYNILL